MRLDQYLSQELQSRTRAQDAIEAGRIRVNGKVIKKAAFPVSDADEIVIEEAKQDFVSRAGGKLEGAVEEFGIQLENQTVLDVGASTGGFTQCCLQHGAKKVYALDVGTLQLSDALRSDERVISMENTNAREISADWFADPIDFVCMDVSFISSLTLLEPLLACMHPKHMVILVKPQFECGKQALNKKGIVKNEKDALAALEKVRTFLKTFYPRVCAMPSPVVGRKGNQEYLLYAFHPENGLANPQPEKKKNKVQDGLTEE